MFTEADLTEALDRAGSEVGREVSAYLIGGAAMAFMGRKMATKDIDVVFGSIADTKVFVSAMQHVGFASLRKLRGEYDTLGAFAILQDAKGMRFDIFDRQVCRALEISEAMKSRARLYRSFGNLHVYLMSPEDIFLFKGITEREADLDDMRILAETRLDWKTIEEECLSQRNVGRWAYMLGTKLLELRAGSGIDSPIMRTLLDRADLELLTYVFGQIIAERNVSFGEIAEMVRERYKYSSSWTRKQLSVLLRKGIVGLEKKGRSRLYFIKNRN